jgi:hypothetical protein
MKSNLALLSLVMLVSAVLTTANNINDNNNNGAAQCVSYSNYFLYELATRLNNATTLAALATELKVSQELVPYGAQAVFSTYYKMHGAECVTETAYNTNECEAQFAVLTNNFLVRARLTPSTSSVIGINATCSIMDSVSLHWVDNGDSGTTVSWRLNSHAHKVFLYNGVRQIRWIFFKSYSSLIFHYFFYSGLFLILTRPIPLEVSSKSLCIDVKLI